MKLIDAVLQGYCPLLDLDDNDTSEVWRTTPVVLVNEAAELYYTLSARPPVMKLNEMGSLLPQYPQMWIEWVAPQDIPFTPQGETLAQSGSEFRGLSQGVMVHSEQHDAGFHIEMLPFSRRDLYKDVIMLPAVYELEVDTEGAWAGKVTDKGYPEIVVRQLDMGFDAQTSIPAGMNLVKVACLAMGLMNCRNVSTMSMSQSAKLRKARARRTKNGAAFVERWSVLRLPDRARTTFNRSVARNAVGEASPAHLVRAHFKTYTEEHPHMGKNVGRYFWGWAVRGNKAAGQIKRIVEVGA